MCLLACPGRAVGWAGGPTSKSVGQLCCRRGACGGCAFLPCGRLFGKRNEQTGSLEDGKAGVPWPLRARRASENAGHRMTFSAKRARTSYRRGEQTHQTGGGGR